MKQDKRTMKLIAYSLLQLFLMIQAVASMGSRSRPYTCVSVGVNTLVNCTSNPRIRVSKNEQGYNLRVCLSNDCTSSMDSTNFDWIRCNAICNACTDLVGPSACTNNYEECEDEVDDYLNNFCGSLLPYVQVQPTSVATIAPTQCTVTTTVTPSCSPNAIFSPDEINVPVPPPENQLPVRGQASTAPLLALGALLGVSIVLLIMMAIGWVMTCIMMKKRDKEKNEGTTTVKIHDEDAEIYFKNPTYEGSSGQNGVPVGMYDVIRTPYQRVEGNGHTYETLDNQQAQRDRTTRDASDSHIETGESNGQLHGVRDYYEINEDAC